MSECAYPCSLNNHSRDKVTVYHGAPEPTVLCGYHASWPLNDVLTAIRTGRDILTGEVKS